MPTPECYRDIGAIGARLDEIEKARIEREATIERARIERDEQIDAALAVINEKMDSINDERQRLIGVIWAVRVLFGSLVAIAIYAATNGVPQWLRRSLQ
ncbi:hypothetical protein [Methylocystis heyeri]|uniref:Uncharacterized protein n=1 Tax=Methylocystis heyeri TaxID=391905 RepID=A0A6B8KHB8_9HYPH|nr:hypothetical protein [Methylocystis heyeri]QGM45850.1 hypothetical protein H2LOC_009125 [Methylocystis heyeri]